MYRRDTEGDSEGEGTAILIKIGIKHNQIHIDSIKTLEGVGMKSKLRAHQLA